MVSSKHLSDSITAALSNQRGFTGFAPRKKFEVDADGFPLGRSELFDNVGQWTEAQKAEAIASANRLVKGSKCPTARKPDSKKEKTLFRSGGYLYDVAETDHSTGEIPSVRLGEYGSHRFTVVTHRKWSNEYRIRTEVQMPGQLPPQQSGSRVTTELSLDGARKISDSAHYMALHRQGFTTFGTLTCTDEARSRVELRTAEGPCIELEQYRGRYITVRKKLTSAPLAGIAVKPDGSPMPETSMSSSTRLSRQDLSPVDKDGPHTPVQLIGGCYYALATRESGDDMTFETLQPGISAYVDKLSKMRQRGWKAQKQYPWGKVSCLGSDGQVLGEPPSQVVEVKRKYDWGKVSCIGFDEQPIGGEPGPDTYEMNDDTTQIRRGVSYAWVVENPLNARGRRNPHIHILFDWEVPYELFSSWVDRLEALWGKGYNSVEKIHEPAKAGAYLAKAAGYLTSGQKGDQGPVRGNRYGISRNARAPEWAEIGRYELGVMGHFIADVYDYWTELYGHLFRERSKLRDKISDTHTGTRKRAQLQNALTRVRDQITDLPIVSSRYQIICKDAFAFSEFIQWASSDYSVSWLPQKLQGDYWDPDQPTPDTAWKHEFLQRMHAARAQRRSWNIPLSVYEELEAIEQQNFDDQAGPAPDHLLEGWHNYEGLHNGSYSAG